MITIEQVTEISPHPENVSCDISFGENEMTCRLKNAKENRIIFHYYASTNITRLK